MGRWRLEARDTNFDQFLQCRQVSEERRGRRRVVGGVELWWPRWAGS